MRFSITRDLGLKLLALYLLFVGPVVIALLVFDNLTTERLENDVKAADLSLARTLAQETNTFLDNALQTVRQLSISPEVINSEVQGMEKIFQTLMIGRPDIDLIYRLDHDGRMLYHYPTGPGTTVGINFSFRDYYIRALDTHNPFFSKGRKSPTTKQPVATAVMPMWSDSGYFQGLIATNIKLQSFSHTFSRIITDLKHDAAIQIVIVDSVGQVIAHSDPQLVLTDMNLENSIVSTSVLAGRSENNISKNKSGKWTLYSYVPIPSIGWGVIVSRSIEDAFSTIRMIHRWYCLRLVDSLLSEYFSGLRYLVRFCDR
jgi:hypothetical protein